MILNSNRMKRGIIMTELVMYVALFGVLVFIMTRASIDLFKAFNLANSAQSMSQAATVAMGRVIYTVRDANYLDINNSYFSTTSTSVASTSNRLTVIWENEDESATTTTFYAGGTNLFIQQVIAPPDSEPGTGKHHESCVSSADCDTDYPVCCIIPSHNNAPVCEKAAHHGGLCGQPVIVATTPALPLLPPNIALQSLKFWNLSTSSASSVRIELILIATSNKGTTTAPFYSTAVLRGSY